MPYYDFDKDKDGDKTLGNVSGGLSSWMQDEDERDGADMTGLQGLDDPGDEGEDEQEDEEGSGSDLADPWVVPDPPPDEGGQDAGGAGFFDPGEWDVPELPDDAPPPPPASLRDRAQASVGRAANSIRIARSILWRYLGGSSDGEERAAVEAALERCLPGVPVSLLGEVVRMLDDAVDALRVAQIVPFDSVEAIMRFFPADPLSPAGFYRATLEAGLTPASAWIRPSDGAYFIFVYPALDGYTSAARAAIMAHEAFHFVEDAVSDATGGARTVEHSGSSALDNAFALECLVVELSELPVDPEYAESLERAVRTLRP